MSVYITGDSHGDFSEFGYRLKKNNINPEDTLIICGDFGFDWDDKCREKWDSLKHDYNILFCDGNHENYDVLNTLPTKEMFGDVVGVFGENTYRLLTGHMYNIEGKKFFVFGGAASIDKDWRVNPLYIRKYGKLWWEEEVPTQEQYEFAIQTLKDNNFKFDYMISHTCRPSLKGPVLNSYKVDFHDPTEVMIENIEEYIKENGGDWKESYFGHFHTDVNYEKYHCLYKNVVKAI